MNTERMVHVCSACGKTFIGSYHTVQGRDYRVYCSVECVLADNPNMSMANDHKREEKRNDV